MTTSWQERSKSKTTFYLGKYLSSSSQVPPWQRSRTTGSVCWSWRSAGRSCSSANPPRRSPVLWSCVETIAQIMTTMTMGRRITTISISTQHHFFIIISDNNRIRSVSRTQHQHALAGIPQIISTILSDLHSISITTISISSSISISIFLPASHRASAPTPSRQSTAATQEGQPWKSSYLIFMLNRHWYEKIVTALLK